jgi:hypothetical protein
MALWYILWHFGIFYGTLVYFMALWYILWHFGIFFRHLVYFMALWYTYFVVSWYIVPQKNWQPYCVIAIEILVLEDAIETLILEGAC